MSGVHCARGSDLEGVWRALAKEPCRQAPRKRLVVRLRLEGALLIQTLAQRIYPLVDAAPCRIELCDLRVQKARLACERGELHLQSDRLPSKCPAEGDTEGHKTL